MYSTIFRKILFFKKIIIAFQLFFLNQLHAFHENITDRFWQYLELRILIWEDFLRLSEKDCC